MHHLSMLREACTKPGIRLKTQSSSRWKIYSVSTCPAMLHVTVLTHLRATAHKPRVKRDSVASVLGYTPKSPTCDESEEPNNT